MASKWILETKGNVGKGQAGKLSKLFSDN